MASSVIEVLSTWPPGLVLAMADHISWRNALTAAELEQARANA
jgi:hypothetical protein